MALFSKLLRAGEGRKLNRYKKLAAQVLELSDEMEALSDEELQAKTAEFRKRLEDEDLSLDDLLIEAFAVAREAAFRVLGQRPYEVQVIGGIALYAGNVAEMKTGEGKTLTSIMPAYLTALGGKGVHIVTVNDYLAKRDADWMGRVHRWLGLSVGAILAQQSPDVRREAYEADITYGTNNEFGFDYLRDNMAMNKAQRVQRGHHYAIVDEVDSILIDEARTPLIISGPADATSSRWYREFARLAPLMNEDVHYEVDRKKRTIGISEAGVEFVEDQLGIDNLYESANSPLVSYLNNSVKAKELFTRDKDYIVRNGEVVIVDEFTGRVLDGRRYNEGMHQAIEAKEGVEIKAENQTLATITLQNYFRMYDKLGGMTGTAETEAAELSQTYKLDVVPIPTNRPQIREDKSDLIYKTEEAKFAAVVDDIAERVEKKQPVLVGTASVERSEYLSRLLNKRGIDHHVLNAKYHASEAQIVAQAGRLKAVTVATNMAGRGTDIVLGGNPDILADLNLRKRGLDPVENAEEYEAAWDDEIERMRKLTKEEGEKVREVGGLYVLGTERHDSRRIDNQLRGRSGRQGDPGESRFYLSLGDELMRRFNGAAVEAIMNRLNLPDDVPIEAKMVTRTVKNAQAQVEAQNFEVRKNVLKYDEVMNAQRKEIYNLRNDILEGEDIHLQIEGYIYRVVEAYVAGETATGYYEDWDLEKLWDALRQLYPVSIDYTELHDGDKYGPAGDLSPEDLQEAILDDIYSAYDKREEEVIAASGRTDEDASEAMRELERGIMLQTLDRKWREHLYEMDYLKEGIGLRAMAQRDPLVEYQREGFDMFSQMLEGLREETVGFVFNTKVAAAVQTGPSAAQAARLAISGLDGALSPANMHFTGPDESGNEAEVDESTPSNRSERRSKDKEDKRAARKERLAAMEADSKRRRKN